MITFIKVKLKKSNDKTNIDKLRVAANIILFYNKFNLPKKYHFKFLMIDKVIISCKNVKIIE